METLASCGQNWATDGLVPPSGGSLEIGNSMRSLTILRRHLVVPPSGGSLEIGNNPAWRGGYEAWGVPPSGGSLEIGNKSLITENFFFGKQFPLRGDP